jgi:biopolymer transport protein ExbD
MNFQFEAHKKYLSIFNFSSLTDIVLLLLIFFLLTSSFAVIRGLDVVLPKAVTGSSPQRSTVTVVFTKDRKLFVGAQPVTKNQLADKLKSVVRPDQQIVIQADKNLILEEVVEVLDIAKGVGMTRLFIATEPVK